MPGPHSGWPYPTGDPNPTEEQALAEAGQILGKLKTMSISRVAREMNMCRDTVYARIQLISRQIPGVDLVRVIHYERLEEMFEGLQGRIDGDASNADYAKLRAEQRQVLARQSALLRVEAADPESPDVGNDEPDPWVDGARAEAEDQLAKVEHEMRNGHQP